MRIHLDFFKAKLKAAVEISVSLTRSASRLDCCVFLASGPLQSTITTPQKSDCPVARGYVSYEFDSPSGDVCNLAYIGAKNLNF